MTKKVRALVLVGAPNSGKTTLYNWLTASHYATVNYPGSTVEYQRGELAIRYGRPTYEIFDSPGVYSLFPKSEDEVVTRNLILENKSNFEIAGAVVVIDATQMVRQLVLAEQIYRTGLPMMIVLTMADLLKKNCIKLDLQVLRNRFACDVVEFDGLLGGGLDEIISSQRNLLSSFGQRPAQITLMPWSENVYEEVAKECERLTQGSLVVPSQKGGSFTQQTLRMDRWLLHPIWGAILFLGIMTVLFASVFWFAAPFMDLIDGGFSGLAGFIVDKIPSLWGEFLGNGIVASLGAVLVFVPQIFILFFGIGMLGDSGYLARAASLIDRPLAKMGLTGRSFVPLLSGFACAVPAIMATRNISSRRDRWLTAFIIPLLTCSARLPVYALLIGFIFRGKSVLQAGLFLTFMYILSLVTGFVVAGVLNKILPKSDPSFLIMELPILRKPVLKTVISQASRRTKMYLKRAGIPIFVVSTLIWVSSTFPNYQNPDPTKRISSSYLGQIGQLMEPVWEPMGVDWRVGIGLLSAFAAREVFVSTLAIVFHVTTSEDDNINDSLLSAMDQATFENGKKIFTLASVSGLLAFVMVALQCISTVAISLKESGSWRTAFAQLFLFNLMAYGMAVIVFKVLSIQGL